jgi:hypothetical protein
MMSLAYEGLVTTMNDMAIDDNEALEALLQAQFLCQKLLSLQLQDLQDPKLQLINARS